MAMYEADPKFEVFNTLIPYAPFNADVTCECCQDHRARFHDFKFTARSQARDSNVARVDGDQHHAPQPSTSAAVPDIPPDVRQMILEIPKLMDQLESKDATNLLVNENDVCGRLRIILDTCHNVLAVDIDHVARVAAALGSVTVLEMLHESFDASVLSRDTDGRSPAIYATHAPRQDAIAVLRHIFTSLGGRDVVQREFEHADRFGSSVMSYASVNTEHYDIVQLCILYGLYQAEDIEKMAPGEFYHDEKRALALALHACTSQKHNFNIGIISPPRPYISWQSFLTHDSGKVWSDRDEPKWLHIPSLNAVIIYVSIQVSTVTSADLIKAILRLRFPRHGGNLIAKEQTAHDDDEQEIAVYTPWRSFLESFKIPPTVPGDRDLAYREPHFEQNRAPWRESSIVLPYFLLDSLDHFKWSRDAYRSVRREMKWPQLGKYVQGIRSLDEAYYPSLSRGVLDTRNQDQVVTRECTETVQGNKLKKSERPILLVAQLWIWERKELVVSAAPTLDPSPAYWDVFGDINTVDFSSDPTEQGLTTSLLLLQYVQQFGQIQARGRYQSALDIFEIGVIRIISDVDAYMADDNLDFDASEKEKRFVKDISDIRDELAMIDDVLGQQSSVILAARKSYETRNKLHGSVDDEDYLEEMGKAVDNLTEALDLIETYQNRVKKIDKDAERIDKNIQDRLSLKRTFATIRDAKTSILLAIAVIGFTVITIVFAPLAFMTALFALNIDVLVKNKKGTGDDAMYSSGYVAWSFILAEVATIGLTIILVWICLSNRDRLASWAEGRSYVKKKVDKPHANHKATSSSKESSAVAVDQEEHSAVDIDTVHSSQIQTERNSTTSSISNRPSTVSSHRRRQAAHVADAEERGENSNVPDDSP